YPLYTLLGYVVSHALWWGEVAWRVNALSAFFGALAVGAMYVLIVEVSRYTVWLARTKAAQRQAQRQGQRQRREAPVPRGKNPKPAQPVRQRQPVQEVA